MIWRVGRRVPRNLYRDDVDVGRLDTPEIAREIAAGMNDVESLRAQVEVLTAELKRRWAI